MKVKSYKVELTIDEIGENLVLLAANIEHQRMLYKSKLNLDKETVHTLGYLRGVMFSVCKKWNEVKEKL